jgi:hypothetical protein
MNHFHEIIYHIRRIKRTWAAYDLWEGIAAWMYTHCRWKQTEDEYDAW